MLLLTFVKCSADVKMADLSNSNIPPLTFFSDVTSTCSTLIGRHNYTFRLLLLLTFYFDIAFCHNVQHPTCTGTMLLNRILHVNKQKMFISYKLTHHQHQ